MLDAELVDLLRDNVLLVALSALRVSMVFVLLPLFTREGIPPLIRNSIYLALALVSVAVQPAVPADAFQTDIWIMLFAKEALIGIAIGFFFGIYLWAFEAAGVIIDMQVGSSFALFLDPIVGNEVTLIGSLLGRLATYLFLASGGLMLLAGALLESFAIWPLFQPITGIKEASVMLFETELSRFMFLVVRIAGPVMVVLFVIDLAMGLINRYAQQFNVFFLSISVKSMASILMLIILLPYLVEVLVGEMGVQAGGINAYLQQILLR